MYIFFYFSFYRHCFVMEWIYEVIFSQNTNKKLSGFLPYTLQGRKPDNFSFIFSEERISFWILPTFIKKMVILSLINIHHTTFFFEMWKLESVHNILFFILQALFCHGIWLLHLQTTLSFRLTKSTRTKKRHNKKPMRRKLLLLKDIFLNFSCSF